MSTEHASGIRCIKTGAGYACLWAAVLGLLLWSGVLQSSHIDDTPGAVFLCGSLAAVALGIPVLCDKRFRHPGCVIFLAVGALAASALLAILAGAAFLVYLFLGYNPSTHR